MSDKFNIDETTPLRDYIIAEIVIQATKSGIILSENAKENAAHTLTAVKVGPDVKDVKVGDVLMVHPYSFHGERLQLSDSYVMLPESVVIAVKRNT